MQEGLETDLRRQGLHHLTQISRVVRATKANERLHWDILSAFQSMSRSTVPSPSLSLASAKHVRGKCRKWDLCSLQLCQQASSFPSNVDSRMLIRRRRPVSARTAANSEPSDISSKDPLHDGGFTFGLGHWLG